MASIYKVLIIGICDPSRAKEIMKYRTYISGLVPRIVCNFLVK